jgi:hypothetical protein
MYSLEVFYAGDKTPRHVERLLNAADVLKRVHALLAQHEGCETVVVYSEHARLFAVDCRGNRLPH